jgi:hypothetical protein
MTLLSGVEHETPMQSTPFDDNILSTCQQYYIDNGNYKKKLNHPQFVNIHSHT